MNRKQDLFDYDSLAFFGSVNASISHELKNIMAIISETAGLLNDLADMASGEAPIKLDMLRSCTGSISEEIQRGFLTIRQMNRFSHSVDTPVVSVDLMDLLDRVSNLSGYLSFSGKIRIEPCRGARPVATTSPFLLQAIIYQALSASFQNTGPGGEMTIAVSPKNDSAWRIRITGFSIKEYELFPDERIRKMAESIDVAIYRDGSDDRLDLDVPVSIHTDTPHDAPDVSDTSGIRP